LSLAAFGFISYGQLRYNFIGASKQSQSMEEDKSDNCKYLIAPMNKSTGGKFNLPILPCFMGQWKLKLLAAQFFLFSLDLFLREVLFSKK